MANILVDIDDTLAQTQSHNIDYIKKQHGKDYNFSDMTREYREGHDIEYAKLVGQFLQDKQVISEIKPYSFALDSLKMLHQAGHTIHIVSSRRENLHKVTEDWLREHGFIDYVHLIHPRYSNLHGKDFKLKIAQDNKLTIAFDDTWDVSEALAGAGVRVFLIHKPWNQDEELTNMIIRVDDFRTGVELFLSEQS